MSLTHGNFFTHARAQVNHMTGGVDLCLIHTIGGKDYDVQLLKSPNESPPGSCHVSHTLQYSEAQLLLDALLGAGMKPTVAMTEEKTEAFSAGKVEAMTAHLADLRRLAFGREPEEIQLSADTPRTRADMI
jgi:hypothetical protein